MRLTVACWLVSHARDSTNTLRMSSFSSSQHQQRESSTMHQLYVMPYRIGLICSPRFHETRHKQEQDDEEWSCNPAVHSILIITRIFGLVDSIFPDLFFFFEEKQTAYPPKYDKVRGLCSHYCFYFSIHPAK